MIYFLMVILNELMNDLKGYIEKYNSVYISKGATSFPPINLKIPNEIDKKISEEFGIDENLIFTISFTLRHKRLEWSLKKNEHNDGDRSYYVRIQGFDLADDEYGEKYFPNTYDAIDYIKNQIMKTYEKFQNL